MRILCADNRLWIAQARRCAIQMIATPSAMNTVAMRSAGRPTTATARQRQGPSTEAVALTFEAFRSILARQPEELLGSASAGGGKKGKKGKKGK